MVDEVFEDLKDGMEKALKAFHKDLGKIRTGRASMSILDGIRIDYYGTPTPLNQIATLAIPESRLIVIQPWEKKMTTEIEKAILHSDLGLTPTNDGKVVRIAFPPLTEERRKDLAKLVGKMAEEARIVVRKARRDAVDMFKELEKDGDISEDDLRRDLEKVQKVHDEYIEKVNESQVRKEKEVMEV
jgi:ribosome recycling factor